MEKLYWKDRIIGSCVIILCLIMLTIFGKAFVSKVIVEKLGVHNAVTNYITEEAYTVQKTKKVDIDWEKEYPFEKAGKFTQEDSLQAKIEQKINHSSRPEERLTSWVRKNLWGYSDRIENAREMDQRIGWNLYRQDGVPVKDLGNGNWSHIWPKTHTAKKVDAVTTFQQFCRQLNIPFLFVQAPIKISREMERQRPELGSYANINADEIVDGLKKRGVAVLDIRDQIEEEGANNLDLFFKTDHHWKPETALWATNYIIHALENMNIISEPFVGEAVNPALYRKEVYKNNFLGSSGRAVTLARSGPEDISLFYPLVKTDFTYVIPELGLNKRGDFTVMYDFTQVRDGDFYNKNSYAAYGYGDQAYIRIQNHQQQFNGKKVLLVKDSFGDAVGPFLAMALPKLDIIDLRSFKGSLKSFIRMNKPDAVIVLYSSNVESAVKPWGKHGDPFDFR